MQCAVTFVEHIQEHSKFCHLSDFNVSPTGDSAHFNVICMSIDSSISDLRDFEAQG